ncbi:DUF1707 domain-containing protein [Rhodococcus spelaei]|uniref:DUF1707 domain-containing protein n=1 Tax=Rhodococcus spelaei TaxID=2546320 RepID=A0A541BA43_9NOCA|nr:DUF1707 domain-containing protein [Rhodococcus spelaei]TQF69187.1 DUF1707 domain-containing protein [Rhodococcus spelaei]
MAELPGTRIGTFEREQAVELLTRHLGEGRLTLAEFGDRCALVESARTNRDLAVLFSDLPDVTAQSGRRRLLWLLVPVLLVGLYLGLAAADLTMWFMPAALVVVVGAGVLRLGTRRRRPARPGFLATEDVVPATVAAAPRRNFALIPYALVLMAPALMLRLPIVVLAAVGFLIFAVVQAVDNG